MKIRIGFVTNSSSSSYVLIIKNEKPEGFFSLVDMLKMYSIGSKLTEITPDGTLKFSNIPDKRDFDIQSVKDYLCNTEWKVDHNKEETENLRSEIERLNKFLKLDDDTILLAGHCKDIETARLDINLKLSSKEKKIKILAKESEEIGKAIALLNSLDSDEYDIVTVDVDHWGGSRIEEMIINSGAAIIKKETT